MRARARVLRASRERPATPGVLRLPELAAAELSCDRARVRRRAERWPAHAKLTLCCMHAQASFDSLSTKWIRKVMEEADQGCHICLVGTKLDLIQSGQTQRAVKAEEVEALAQKHNAHLFETSSKQVPSVCAGLSTRRRGLSPHTASQFSLGVARACALGLWAARLAFPALTFVACAPRSSAGRGRGWHLRSDRYEASHAFGSR